MPVFVCPCYQFCILIRGMRPVICCMRASQIKLATDVECGAHVIWSYISRLCSHYLGFDPFSRCVSLVSVAFKAYIVVVIVYYCQPQVPELLSGGHFRLYWVFPIGSPHTLQAWEVPTGCGVLFMSTWHDFWQSLDSVTNDKNLEVLIVHPCE